jgi:hypothetical protein
LETHKALTEGMQQWQQRQQQWQQRQQRHIVVN